MSNISAHIPLARTWSSYPRGGWEMEWICEPRKKRNQGWAGCDFWLFLLGSGYVCLCPYVLYCVTRGAYLDAQEGPCMLVLGSWGMELLGTCSATLWLPSLWKLSLYSIMIGSPITLLILHDLATLATISCHRARHLTSQSDPFIWEFEIWSETQSWRLAVNHLHGNLMD